MSKRGPQERDDSEEPAKKKARYEPVDAGVNQDLALISAAKNGDIETVKALLEKGANINAADKKGFTALMGASANGHTEIVKVLLERGANINVALGNGDTALILASRHGYTETVKALIDARANINAASYLGVTALISASFNGHTETVKALIDADANINAVSYTGVTALILASQKGHTETVKALIDAGANINAADENGFTALMEASQRGDLEIVKVLLQKNASLTLRDQNGRNALDYAIDASSVACAQLLAQTQSKAEAAPFRRLVSEERRKKMYDVRSSILKDKSLYYVAYSLLNPEKDEQATDETFATKKKKAKVFAQMLAVSGIELTKNSETIRKKKEQNLAFKQGLALLFSSNIRSNHPDKALPEEIRLKILNYCTGPLTYDKREEEKTKSFAADVYKRRFGM